MATLGDGLDTLDFASLPRYHIYAKLQNHGRDTGWVQGVTLPKPEPLQSAEELRVSSMERYGVPVETIEAELKSVFQNTAPSSEEEAKGFRKSGVGRRRKEEKDE